MANDNVLEEDELLGWRSLMKANANLVGSLDRELEQNHNLGLPDYEVLTHLSSSSDQSLRMTELAREVLLSPSGLTRRLDGLVKAGLVERQPCPSDGRGLLAVITPKGRERLDEMQPTYVKGVRKHFVGFISKDQLQELIKTLEPITAQDETTSTPRVADIAAAEKASSPMGSTASYATSGQQM